MIFGVYISVCFGLLFCWDFEFWEIALVMVVFGFVIVAWWFGFICVLGFDLVLGLGFVLRIVLEMYSGCGEMLGFIRLFLLILGFWVVFYYEMFFGFAVGNLGVS